jgi:RNA polymerase subunit RPABC4/transcription elongation factor Spt4
MPVSPLDVETTDQRVEYACPRCDGVVDRDDTVCPHCGQQLERESGISEWVEAVAAVEEELPVPPVPPVSPVPSAKAETVAARRVNIASLPGRIVGVLVGFVVLLVGALIALLGAGGALAGSDLDGGPGTAGGLVILGVGVFVGWVGVAIIRLAWSSD